eukprot:gnl/MRDRNA2_/MRDRNA2_62035_c0_seq1.p1 gnl/MRDRNA2_/MRDRNA2_62035_c0~~gnl/MRDRNA2_/MRDRNA2_62035_c0_seq1.p1  ORF type:complete len:595 (-),score=173.84 gnl/MRDRNA2_/MRDRNA2_62035_c0_seq1:44-1828(-)
MPRFNWTRIFAGLLIDFAGQNICAGAASTTDAIVKGIPPLAALFPFSQSADKMLKEAAETLAPKKRKKKPKAQSAIDREMGLPPYVDDLDLDEAIEENPAVVAEFTAPEGSGPNIPWKINMKALKEEMKALGSQAKLVRVDVIKHGKLAAEFGQSHGPWPTLLMFKRNRQKIEVPLGTEKEMATAIVAMEIPGYKTITKSQQDQFLTDAKGVAMVASAAYRSSNAIAYQKVAEQLLTDPVWNSGYGTEIRCAYIKQKDDLADRWHELHMKIPGQHEFVTYPHPTWNEAGIREWALKATYPALWQVEQFDHYKFVPDVVKKLGFTASVVLVFSSRAEDAAAKQAFEEVAKAEFAAQRKYAFAAAPLNGVTDVSKVVLGVTPLDSDRTQLTILSQEGGANKTYVTTDSEHFSTPAGIQNFLSDFTKGKLEPLPPPPVDTYDPKKVMVLDPEVGATEITDSDWDSVVMDPTKDVFVMFTAPDEECQLCAELKPKWKELAQRAHYHKWDKSGLMIVFIDGKANPKHIPSDGKFQKFPHFALYKMQKDVKKKKKKKLEHFGNSDSATRMVKDPDLQKKFEDVILEQAETVRSKLMHLEL